MATAKLGKNEQIIIGAMSDAGTPLSAYQILDQEDVRAAGIKAPLTVYRALSRLIDAGRVHRIETLNAFVVCEHQAPHAEPAVFMICEACKLTIEVETDGLNSALQAQAAEQGFEIARVNVEIAGACAACRNAG